MSHLLCPEWISTISDEIPSDMAWEDVDDIVSNNACNRFYRNDTHYSDRDGDDTDEGGDEGNTYCSEHDRETSWRTEEDFWSQAVRDLDDSDNVWVCLNDAHDDKYRPIFDGETEHNEHLAEEHGIDIDEATAAPQDLTIGTRVRILQPQWNDRIWGFLGTITDETGEDISPGRIPVRLDLPNPTQMDRDVVGHDRFIIYCGRHEISIEAGVELIPDWLRIAANQLAQHWGERELVAILWHEGTHDIMGVSASADQDSLRRNWPSYTYTPWPFPTTIIPASSHSTWLAAFG